MKKDPKDISKILEELDQMRTKFDELNAQLTEKKNIIKEKSSEEVENKDLFDDFLNFDFKDSKEISQNTDSGKETSDKFINSAKEVSIQNEDSIKKEAYNKFINSKKGAKEVSDSTDSSKKEVSKEVINSTKEVSIQNEDSIKKEAYDKFINSKKGNKNIELISFDVENQVDIEFITNEAEKMSLIEKSKNKESNKLINPIEKIGDSTNDSFINSINKKKDNDKIIIKKDLIEKSKENINKEVFDSKNEIKETKNLAIPTEEIYQNFMSNETDKNISEEIFSDTAKENPLKNVPEKESLIKPTKEEVFDEFMNSLKGEKKNVISSKEKAANKDKEIIDLLAENKVDNIVKENIDQTAISSNEFTKKKPVKIEASPLIDEEKSENITKKENHTLKEYEELEEILSTAKANDTIEKKESVSLEEEMIIQSNISELEIKEVEEKEKVSYIPPEVKKSKRSESYLSIKQRLDQIKNNIETHEVLLEKAEKTISKIIKGKVVNLNAHKEKKYKKNTPIKTGQNPLNPVKKNKG